MNTDMLRDALLASGGNVLQADLGSPVLSALLGSFNLPAIAGPVSVEGNRVIVHGAGQGLDAKVTFEVEGGQASMVMELGMSGTSREMLQRVLPGHALPLPDALLSSALTLAVLPNGAMIVAMDFQGSLEGVSFGAKVLLGVDKGALNLAMTGSATCVIQGRDVEFTVSAELSPNGLIIFGNMDGTLQFGDFQLSNVGLAIGVDAELIPSVGLSASLAFDRASASVAVLFDSVDPLRSLVSGHISPMSLLDAIELFGQVDVPDALREPLSQIAIEGTGGFTLPEGAGASLAGRDFAGIERAFAQCGRSFPGTAKDVLLVAARGGGRWFLTDRSQMTHYLLQEALGRVVAAREPQLCIALSDTRIGTQSFPEGICLSGALRIFFLRMENRIHISRGRGALVVAAMDPIVFLHPNFASITAHGDASRGPTLNISTFHDSQAASPDLAPPHCLITGQVRLLGLSAGVSVKISSSGLQYTIQTDGLVSYLIRCSIATDAGFEAHGRLSMGGQTFDLGRLGSVQIPSVSVSLDASCHSGQAWARAAFACRIGGFDFNESVELAVDVSPLTDVVDFIKTQLRNLAPRLDPAAWAGMVRAGVIQGAEAVGTVLAEVFHQGSQGAASVMRQAGYGADEVGQVLRDTFEVTGQAAQSLLTSVGYGAEEAANAVGVALLGAAQVVGEGVIDAAQGAGQLGLQVATATGEGVIAVGNKIGKAFGF